MFRTFSMGIWVIMMVHTMVSQWAVKLFFIFRVNYLYIYLPTSHPWFLNSNDVHFFSLKICRRDLYHFYYHEPFIGQTNFSLHQYIYGIDYRAWVGEGGDFKLTGDSDLVESAAPSKAGGNYMAGFFLASVSSCFPRLTVVPVGGSYTMAVIFIATTVN